MRTWIWWVGSITGGLVMVGMVVLVGRLLNVSEINVVSDPVSPPNLQTEDILLPGEAAGQPYFSWQYHSFERGEMPYTSIVAIAHYADDQSVAKEVDEIVGGCNEYSLPDVDVYERSTMIICYYAGLGHYFKIVADEHGYQVQRRVFEEASPDYDPPIEPYETIVRF